LILPDPVTVKRFFALEVVFIFGILISFRVLRVLRHAV